MEFWEYKYSFKNQFRTMASLSVYRTGYQQCSSNYTRGTEIRDFYLIHFVIAGKGTYSLNGKRFPVHAGDAFLIYPNMPINYQADRINPWEFCWVGFNGTDARLIMNATGFSPQMPVITPGSPDTMLRLMRDIYECRGGKIHESMAMTGRLYTLLSYLKEDAMKDAAPPYRSGVIHVQHACDYIASHYSQPITVNDIAAHVNVCRSRLYRVFMQHISLSPIQYLTEFRIREACNVMHKQSAPVKEIAYAVGFDNPLYFSSIFKRITGLSPREYMKQAKRNGAEEAPQGVNP